ncbi:hypothetical protein LLH23_05180 [bacterium]|nr:hypothetical protein [bacterium]
MRLSRHDGMVTVRQGNVKRHDRSFIVNRPGRPGQPVEACRTRWGRANVDGMVAKHLTASLPLPVEVSLAGEDRGNVKIELSGSGR